MCYPVTVEPKRMDEEDESAEDVPQIEDLPRGGIPGDQLSQPDSEKGAQTPEDAYAYRKRLLHLMMLQARRGGGGGGRFGGPSWGVGGGSGGGGGGGGGGAGLGGSGGGGGGNFGGGGGG